MSIPFSKYLKKPASKPVTLDSKSTCKHSQLDIEVVRGRCKACGMEVKTAQMKKVIANDQKTLYSMGFKAGYLKAGDDAKRPAVPIAIPASVLEAEAKEAAE